MLLFFLSLVLLHSFYFFFFLSSFLPQRLTRVALCGSFY